MMRAAGSAAARPRSKVWIEPGAAGEDVVEVKGRLGVGGVPDLDLEVV
jgi:hypothetical protein